MTRIFIVAAAVLFFGAATAQSLDRTITNTTARLVVAPIRFNAYYMSVLPLDAAFAINGSGAIAGRVGGNAAVYLNGQVTILPGKVGYTNLVANDIADNGYIVGSALSYGNRRGLFWPSMTSPPIDMGALGAWTQPLSVNSQGTAVGWYSPDLSGSSATAFRWSIYSGMQSIAPATTTTSQAYDISESGYIAGQAWYSHLGQQVVRWYPDGGIGRVTGPGYANRAQENGSIFGIAGGVGANLWTINNTAVPLGPKPSTHVVTQISSRGRMVGYTLGEPPLDHAWTTVSGSTTALTLPSPSGALSFAYDVNSCGTIVGSVTLSSGTQQAVMWSRNLCDLPVLVAQ